MSIYVNRTEPWYTENWYDEDIEAALEALGITINENTMGIARKTLEGIFDDKSERNEIIHDCLYIAFY